MAAIVSTELMVLQKNSQNNYEVRELERALHHKRQIFFNVAAGLVEITQTSLE